MLNLSTEALILFNLSIALFGGLVLSRFAKKVGLPAVTAYLIAGIIVGPYVIGAIGVEGLGFTSMENVESYGIICDVALGFIAFSIGNEFRLEDLKKTGRQALVIGILQALTATVLVDSTDNVLGNFVTLINTIVQDTCKEFLQVKMLQIRRTVRYHSVCSRV